LLLYGRQPVESGLTESAYYDVFMFGDKEVFKDEWNSLTNEYLSNSSDLIIWMNYKQISYLEELGICFTEMNEPLF
jgi:hypothetical protein